MSDNSPESVPSVESGILLRDDDDDNTPSRKREGSKVFEELSTLRIDKLKATDKSIEGLVKKCLFWKDQLDGILEKNRLLRQEEKALQKDYEELLEKTRSNTGVLESLKDSEKTLSKELKDCHKENHHLSAASYINVDLSSYRISLESDKKELIKNLKNDNDKLSKINRIHQRIQDAILQQKKSIEMNERRFSGVLAMLKECFDRDTNMLKEVNEGFVFRDTMAQRVDKLINNEDPDNTKTDLEDSSDVKSVEDDSTASISKRSDDSYQTPTSETSENQNNLIQTSETSDDQNDQVQTTGVSESHKNSLTIDANTLSPAMILKGKLEIIKKENVQLHQIYSLLINRMKQLNDLYMENNEVCNRKGFELKEVADRASDLFGLILQTRKKFTIPQRKLTDELDVQIRNQVQKNEALRRLISMFLSLNSDSEFYWDLMSSMQNFYQSELKEKIENVNGEIIP